MTCLSKHPYECCGCSDHPAEPPGSETWLDHIDAAHAAPVGVNNVLRFHT